MKASIFKAIVPHAVAIFILFLANALFFMPQWQGKTLRQLDIVSWQAASQEIHAYEEQTGKSLYWTDAMFGGMPAYQIAMQPKGYFVGHVGNLLSFGIATPAGIFLSMMIAFYILLNVLRVNSWLAIVGALAFGFATNNFVLLEAGHSNKLVSLIYLPLMVAGLFLMFYKKRYLIGAALFGLALGANLGANHIQMTYYFALTLLLLGLVWIVESIREKTFKTLVFSTSLAILGAGFAVGSTVSNLWPTYEYSEDTMRGKPILTKIPDQSVPEGINLGTSSTTDGLDWDYAMTWSNGVQDLFATIIPGAAGGGSIETVSEGATYDAVRQGGGAVNADGTLSIPLYWGPLPSTSGPVYFGAIVCFLFLLGSILVKGSLKWWAVLAVIVTGLLSMGKNAEGFQRLFFDYFPFFNKFRTPNSILTITSFFPALLGIYALSEIIQRKHTLQETQRALFIAGGITAGLTLFFALIGPSFYSFSAPVDSNYQPDIVEFLKQDRKAMLTRDSWRSFLLILGASALIYAYIKNWLGAAWVVASIGVLILFDLWSVGKRYLRPDSYVTKTEYTAQFAKRPADELILSKETSRGDYRVLDMSEDVMSSTTSSYYHNSIGGYSAAKMQRYQDLFDFQIAKSNMGVINMLNTKYVITQDGQLQTNPGALGPVWFVDSIAVVDNPDEEIRALDSINASITAVVLDREFNNYVSGFDPEKGGEISLTKYDPQHLEYTTSAPSEQLAVFSEIWYGPDKGWKAYIDGKEVPHIRANYILRALRIPAGAHKVEFVFKPQSVELGGMISSISSLVLILGFFGIAGLQLRKWSTNPTMPDPLPDFQRTVAATTPPKRSTNTSAKSGIPKKK